VSDSVTDPGIVLKATAVLTRGEGEAREVLVFLHPSVDGSGRSIQLPAGTVEDGEDPADAAVRELAEETGVIGAEVRTFLGVLEEPSFEASPESGYSEHTARRAQLARRRFVYHLEVTLPPPDRWTSMCDCGVEIECHWLPLASAEVHPEQQAWLGLARDVLGGA